MNIKDLSQKPKLRFLLLVGAWLASYVTYTLVFVRPYWLYTYLWTPKLSTGIIANRQAGPAAAFVLGFTALFGLYAAAYHLVRHWRPRELVLGIGVYGLVLALLLAMAYPIGANDLFGYITAGELLAFHDLNPMIYPANHVPGLPLMEYSAYAHIPPNYGPVWTWIEAAVVWAVGKPDLLALTLAFKAVAIAGYGATGLVLVPLLRRRAPDRIAAGLLAFAWNPLVLFEVAVNAHNDIWIGFLILLGVLFWETRRPLPMVAALTLAPLIKVPVAPLVLLFFVSALRQQPTLARRRRFFLAGGLLAGAIVAVSYLSLPEGLRGMVNLQGRTELFTHSLPAVAKLALGLALPERTARLLAGAATVLGFGLYVLVQVKNAWRSPGEVIRLGFNVLVFLLLLCMSWFQPWYLLWAIPLAAAYARSNSPFQLGLFALCASWTYIIFGFVWFWIPSVANWGKALGIELMAALTTYGASWEYAILSGLRAEKP